jgi:hypothetical protein
MIDRRAALAGLGASLCLPGRLATALSPARDTFYEGLRGIFVDVDVLVSLGGAPEQRRKFAESLPPAPLLPGPLAIVRPFAPGLSLSEHAAWAAEREINARVDAMRRESPTYQRQVRIVPSDYLPVTPGHYFSNRAEWMNLKLVYRATDPAPSVANLRPPPGTRLVVWTQEMSGTRLGERLTPAGDRPEFEQARKLSLAAVPNRKPFENWIVDQFQVALQKYFSRAPIFP